MAGVLFGLRWDGRQQSCRVHQGKDAMGKETCELYGYENEVGSIEKHHVVPREVVEQAGLPESRVVRLCCNCHRELHR